MEKKEYKYVVMYEWYTEQGIGKTMVGVFNSALNAVKYKAKQEDSPSYSIHKVEVMD